MEFVAFKALPPPATNYATNYAARQARRAGLVTWPPATRLTR